MKNKFFLIALFVFSLLISDFSEAKGGKSFGGSRSFGGGSKSFGSKPSNSFGGSKSSGTTMQRQSAPSSSFGGSKSTPSTIGKTAPMTSSGISNSYTSKYGAPRKTMTSRDVPGMNPNYRVHDYGGFSSGFMTGYAMASIPWYYSMPFHPAFYYSRPTMIHNADGTVDMYPPSFSFLKLFVGLAILIVVIWLFVKIMKKIRGTNNSGDYSQSSFS